MRQTGQRKPKAAPGKGPARRKKPVSRGTPPPDFWRAEIAQVLIREEQIRTRVQEIARDVQRDYKGKELAVVALLNGTVMFLADLIRELEMPLRLDFMGVSSYGAGTTSGNLVYTKELRLDVKGRHVLLVDDILDTGKTLKNVISKIKKLGPRSIKICVLLDKKEHRSEKVEADFVGFEIPDLFVVGYGLDYKEQYRNLPFVGVLKEHIYSEPV